MGFVPSFAVGAAVSTLLLTYGVHKHVHEDWPPPLHFRQTGLLGLGSGVIWSVGFVCTTLALPAIGYAVAVPLMQCALVFSGLWGVCVFGELPDRRAVRVFFGAAVLTLGGATLLSIYGRKHDAS